MPREVGPNLAPIEEISVTSGVLSWMELRIWFQL